VDARGMGVRTKIIPLTRQFSGLDPLFNATDDFLKTTITKANVPGNVPGKHEISQKDSPETEKAPYSHPANELQGKLLTLIRDNPHITYNELSLKTERARKTVGRHLKLLKENVFLHREGPAKGGMGRYTNHDDF
jgi:predicted HTH transcriptional regulator